MKGQALKAVHDDQVNLLSLACVSVAAEDTFYYLDGLKYKEDGICNRIGLTKECQLFKCPRGYFYL